MVALLLYTYAVGERSSRGIERRCREDVADRVLCAQPRPRPRHDRPLSRSPRAGLADTFEQVLALCAKAGLVSVGLVALDGSVIAGDASQCADPQLRGDPLRGRADGSQRPPPPTRARTQNWVMHGDELPAELCDRRSRRERLPSLPAGARG